MGRILSTKNWRRSSYIVCCRLSKSGNDILLACISMNRLIKICLKVVVGGSQQETRDPGFLLLGTRQQGVLVILRELMLLDGFDPLSPSFTVRDVTTGLSRPRQTFCRTEIAETEQGLSRKHLFEGKQYSTCYYIMVVGGSQQEILDLGFVLLGTRQKSVPVILREQVLPDGFDPVSPSFTLTLFIHLIIIYYYYYYISDIFCETGLRSSLERLQLEYVDIVIVTRQNESSIPVEEVVRTCTHLIHLGWTFYWGTSGWLPCEVMQAQTVARQFNLIPPSVDQNELNLLNKNYLQNMREICLKLNIGIMTGSPLSGGILTGKYIDCIPNFSRATLKNQEDIRDKLLCSKGISQREQVKQLCKIAGRMKCTCAQLAIAWCLRCSHIGSVIIGAATVDQLHENIRSVLIYPHLNASIISELDTLLNTTDSNDNFL
ncbi:unnamed protein product [Schistosoma mattheei]|uniref:NADP-dependent oxidoreductase domain-containing protein n=1 Tax=Schistosoma mattheei TaxID=31246 RepID=A0A3P8CEW4_9TREM|nr:unnamed protein product [Schistosoma mattheei]